MAKKRIKDIAAEAGVSEATISRYLNKNYKAMSEKTRLKIERIIEENDYRPNSMARGLKLKKTNTIGIILADIKNPFSSEILKSLSEICVKTEYSLMICITNNDSAEEEKCLRKYMDKGVDGLIVNTSGGNDELLTTINKQIPVVLLDREIPGKKLDVVTSNNKQLMSDLVEYLYQSQYTKCYLFSENIGTSTVRKIRYDGFISETAARNIDADSYIIPENSNEIEQLLKNIIKEKENEKIAVIAINGLVFLELVKAINQLKIEVGKDIGVATFDEYAWNAVLFGGVTTVVQNSSQIAENIFEILRNRIENSEKSESVRVEIEGKIIIRDSTN